jgi:hypothetical protein
MVECQLKGIFYNCDEKYFPGHKCKEQKLFMAISKDVPKEDVKIPLVDEPSLPDASEEPIEPPKVELLIYLHSLNGFYAPQTLNLIGYINNRKVIILVDSGSTHNFIHRRISQETNFYICVVNNFQIMIVDGGSMKCGGHCENVRLRIGNYHLKYHMFSIEMGGCDIVLGVEWLHTLGLILMDFKELTMQFQHEGQRYHFQCLIVYYPEIINSHRMENFLHKGHSGIISQLHSIHVVETPSMHPNLQVILSKHQAIFSTP